jgi:hypothetical protein
MKKVREQMNRERIKETVRLWQAEPDTALPVATSLDIKRP